MFSTRRETVFVILAGLFIANAVIGEMIGGKLIQVGPFTMSIGVIPWPVVFLTTDLINEYYGKKGVRKLTLLTVALIVYTFLILYLTMKVTASPVSPVSDASYANVFSQSLFIIIGSITAFLFSQMVDVVVFWMFRNRTGGRMLWLRATGSTAISQLIDSFVIIGIAFWLPGTLTTMGFLNLAVTNYSYKLLIAIGLTPLIYLFHNIIDQYLGPDRAHDMIEQAVVESNKEIVTA